MTKRRATVRGRGAEILLGTPDGASEPGPPEPTVKGAQPGGEPGRHLFPDPGAQTSSAVLPEEELLYDEAELERALEEEARAAAPGPEEETEPQAMAGADLVYSAGAFAAVAPPPLAREAAMYQPPPPAASDVVSGVLPPRPEGMHFGYGEEEVAAKDIQEPEERIEPIELPDRELTEEEKAQILARLGDEQIGKLESAIDEVYEAVRLSVGDSQGIATDCFNKLLQARDIVLRRDAAKIPQAEYYIKLVQARLKRATDSEVAAKKYQWWLLVWGMFWFAVLLTLLILLNEAWFRDYFISPDSSGSLVNMEVLLSTMVWGGIGGVVAVLYSLFKHVGQRDFDSHFNLSYVGKPFLGAILGASVYMAFNLLVRALGILPAGLQGVEEISAPVVAPGVMYLMAWIGGFKENRIFDLLDRAMKRVFSGGDAVSEPSAGL